MASRALTWGRRHISLTSHQVITGRGAVMQVSVDQKTVTDNVGIGVLGVTDVGVFGRYDNSVV